MNLEGEFYPPRFWGLDPLFSAKLKVSIRDVLTLDPYPEYPGIYCIGNHPVLGVHVMGDVVSVSEKSALIKYEVDDGTGVLNCVQWRKTKDSEEGIYVASIGELVSVMGLVGEYRDDRQIKITAIFPENDPNAEPCHCLEVEYAWRTVYTQTFTLPTGVTENEEKTLTKSVEEVVKEELMAHLESQTITQFNISSLRGCVEVVDVVGERMRREGGRDVGRATVEKELNTLLRKLPETGLVIPSDVQPSLYYEIFSERKHLYPVILEFVRHKLHHPRVAQQGVPETWIIEHIRGRERFQSVPIARIRSALVGLEEASELFSISKGVYKTIT